MELPELTQACDYTNPDKKWAYPYVPQSLVLDKRGTNSGLNLKDIAASAIVFTTLGSIIGLFWVSSKIQNPRRRAQALMTLLFVVYLIWYMNPGIHIYLLLFFAGLPQQIFMRTPPILNAKEVYPYSQEFEKAYPELKEEIEFFSDHLADSIPFTGEVFSANKGIGSDSDKEGEIRQRKGWRLLILKLGDVIEENCKKFGLETTCSLLRDRPEIYSCAISVLDGGKDIPLHQGYYKGIHRLLFPVIVPDPKNTYICINGMEYHWTEGKGLLFDDMFVHEVHNGSDQRRIMLYMDVQRQTKNEVYNNINKVVLDNTMKLQFTKTAYEKAKQDKVEFSYLNPMTNFHPPKEKASPPIGPYRRNQGKAQPSFQKLAPSIN